jgi:hypothetical protein
VPLERRVTDFTFSSGGFFRLEKASAGVFLEERGAQA